MIECSAAETGMLKKRNSLSVPSSVLGLGRKECAGQDGLSQNLSGGMRPFASEVLSALAPTARAPTLLAITEQFMSEGLPSSPAQNSPSMFSDRIERTE